MKTKITITLVGLALALSISACAAPAGTSNPGSLQITDMWARTVKTGGMTENSTDTMGKTPGAMGSGTGAAMAKQTGAVYMNIANTGAADKLIRAETDAAETVELHTVVEANGMMQMRPVSAIDVPANGSVQLKPGGFHVMLIGVNQELNPGDKITVKLVFEKAGEREIQAEIRAQ